MGDLETSFADEFKPLLVQQLFDSIEECTVSGDSICAITMALNDPPLHRSCIIQVQGFGCTPLQQQLWFLAFIHSSTAHAAVALWYSLSNLCGRQLVAYFHVVGELVLGVSFTRVANVAHQHI